MEFVLIVIMMVTVLFISFSYANTRATYLQEGLDAQEKLLAAIGESNRDLEKHLAHVLSEIQILKGGMMENDEEISVLYDREKLMTQELKSLSTKSKTKKRTPKVAKKLQISRAKVERKLSSPADMVYHMSNKSNSRRSK